MSFPAPAASTAPEFVRLAWSIKGRRPRNVRLTFNRGEGDVSVFITHVRSGILIMSTRFDTLAEAETFVTRYATGQGGKVVKTGVLVK